jgi:hypothetical protein
MDALGIESALVAGFDWGARTADIVAALAGTLQRLGLGERLPDRKPGGRQAALAARGGVAMGVPVLGTSRLTP